MSLTESFESLLKKEIEITAAYFMYQMTPSKKNRDILYSLAVKMKADLNCMRMEIEAIEEENGNP